MDDDDLSVRNATYALFVDLGRAPSAIEVAARHGVRSEEVLASWERLHDAHALVLTPGGTELLMANPFSAVPTRYRVLARERWWYANCAWDAFGICAALPSDGRIESSCPDCDASIDLEVRDASPSDTELVFHCLVPARRWWDDIAFT